MSFVDELKSIKEAALEQKKIDAALKKEKEERQMAASCARAVQRAEKEFPKILQEIKQRAAEGKSSYSINIYQWQSRTERDAYAPLTIAMQETYKKLLTETGLQFKDDHETMEPCGSDSLFHHTVYSYDIVVTW
jgi:membrane-bound lytic murein transglycosylase